MMVSCCTWSPACYQEFFLPSPVERVKRSLIGLVRGRFTGDLDEDLDVDFDDYAILAFNSGQLGLRLDDRTVGIWRPWG